MATFNLIEDVEISKWMRYHYIVDAETIEEAVTAVKEGDAICYDAEDLGVSGGVIPPSDYHATREIRDRWNGKLLYSNK